MMNPMGHIREVTLLKGPVLSVYNYITDLENVTAQMAGKIDVELLSKSTTCLEKGHDFHFLMTRFGLSQEVHIQVEEASRGHRLRYRQTQGIFLSWSHLMEFEAHDANYTKVIDSIDYQLPFGVLGYLLDDLLIRRDVRELLRCRSQFLKKKFESTNIQPSLEKEMPLNPS